MKLQEIMTKQVRTVSPEALVCDVAELLKTEKLGLVAVVQRDNTPLGIVTDREVGAWTCTAKPLVDTQIQNVMDCQVSRMSQERYLETGLALMESTGSEILLVTDAEGRLAGVVTLNDPILSRLKQDNSGQVA